MDDYETDIIVKAERFLAPTRGAHQDYKYPELMHPWPDDFGNQPRDMSWGYVLDRGTKRHVLHGDWIVKWPHGEVEVMDDKDFQRGFRFHG